MEQLTQRRIRARWITDAGLDACIIQTSEYLFYCGYVRIPEGSALFGEDYSGIDASVHGGLTYSGPLDHVGLDAGWWLGFDCGHPGDFSLIEAGIRQIWGSVPEQPRINEPRWIPGAQRTSAYVLEECEHLAKELAALIRRKIPENF